MDNQPQYNPVQPPQQRPTFEPPVEAPQQAPTPAPKKKFPPTILFIIVSLLAVAGVVYSVYAWQQNESLKAEVAQLEKDIDRMYEQKIDEIVEAKNDEPPVMGRINLKDFGVSLASSDKLESLRYTTSISPDTKYVDVSTTEFGGLCELGRIVRMDGTPAQPGFIYAHKQFDGYYIGYALPQGGSQNCPDDVTDNQRRPIIDEIAGVIKSVDLL